MLEQCRCGDERPRGQRAASRPAEDILMPATPVTLPLGWSRSVTVLLRPFTLRQIQLLKLGLADTLQLATGLSQRRLRRLSPQTVAALNGMIQRINYWDPASLAKEMESVSKPNETSVQSLFDYVPELIAAGHSRDGVLDLTPEQFVFFLKASRRAALEHRRDFIAGISTALGAAISKEGGALLKQHMTDLQRAIKQLETPNG
jgi:hypothetical protein